MKKYNITREDVREVLEGVLFMAFCGGVMWVCCWLDSVTY